MLNNEAGTASGKFVLPSPDTTNSTLLAFKESRHVSVMTIPTDVKQQ